jgi:hypothetical protein
MFKAVFVVLSLFAASGGLAALLTIDAADGWKATVHSNDIDDDASFRLSIENYADTPIAWQGEQAQPLGHFLVYKNGDDDECVAGSDGLDDFICRGDRFFKDHQEECTAYDVGEVAAWVFKYFERPLPCEQTFHNTRWVLRCTDLQCSLKLTRYKVMQRDQ